MKARALILAFVFGLFFGPTVAFASEVTEAALAADPVAEKRLQALSAELRCLVCQNQTIADSNAELARTCAAKSAA
jgi:cytochrome c-type biogenesis protein CcmH